MKKLILISCLVIIAAIAVWLFFRQDRSTGISYLTEPVIVGDIVKTVNASGELGAVQLVSVGAQVSGQIKKLHVKLGQKVSK